MPIEATPEIHLEHDFFRELFFPHYDERKARDLYEWGVDPWSILQHRFWRNETKMQVMKRVFPFLRKDLEKRQSAFDLCNGSQLPPELLLCIFTTALRTSETELKKRRAILDRLERDLGVK